MSRETAERTTDKPNHMIVWLDQHIGDPGNCQHLKHSFTTISDPTNSTPVLLDDKDYDELVRVAGPSSVIFEGVKFLLAAFTNAEICVQFMKLNQNKRIFFITSGTLGRVAVPMIMKECRNIFTNPYTGEAYRSIYVYCHSIEHNADWIFSYFDYVVCFDFDHALLVRMIEDVADYFVSEGNRLWKALPTNYSVIRMHLDWARELYDRYNKIQGIPIVDKLYQVHKQINQLEEIQRLQENIDM